MSNPNYFLTVILLLNLVAIALNLFIVSFTKNRYIASTVNILIIIPTSMMSGLFLDFEIMPRYIQKIGSFLPQRCVYKAVENLQIKCGLNSIYDYIFLYDSFIIRIIYFNLYKFRKQTIQASPITL